MIDKRRSFFVIAVFFCFIFLIGNLSALAVSPGKVTMNFVPEYSNNFKYTVRNVPSSAEINISLEGPLAKYASIDKTHLKGDGDFNLELNLPEEINTPGKNRLLVVVEEVPKQDGFNSMLGTSITLKVAIDVFVPYPGRYLEIEKFEAPSVNSGEPIDFKLTLINRGKEDLEIKPYIEITSENDVIETIELGEGVLNKTESADISKTFSTTGLNPGKYNATALVDYGTAVANSTKQIRIGQLSINILNHTKEYDVGKSLREFKLTLGNEWNDKIDGAYAEVVIKNSTDEIAEFKTSTATIKPFGTEEIKGYFNITGISKGNYDAEVTLNYFGKERGKTETHIFDIKFNETKTTKISRSVLILGGLVFIFSILFVLLEVYLRNKKRNKKSRK